MLMDFCEMCWDDMETPEEQATKLRTVAFEMGDINSIVQAKYLNGLPLNTKDFEISFVEKNGTVHTYEAESCQTYTLENEWYVPINYGVEPFYTVNGTGRYNSIDDIVI